MENKAKSKAIELINIFKSALRADNRSWKVEVKNCAKIVVDELIKEVNGHNVTTDYKVEYWNEVMEEIDNVVF